MKTNPTLYLLYLAHGLFMFASVMLAPLFALFATEFTASIETVALLGTIYFGAKAGGTIFTRFIGARLLAPRTSLRIGYLMKIAGCLGFFFATALPQLFIIQVLLGFSEGLHAPAFRALMARNFDTNKELPEAADWEIVLSFTGITGTALGGIIVSYFGFDVLFLVMSGVVATALVLTYRI
ncbi:MAG: MFS transporter [Candidatus Pacebacteria bacterium]|jgi:predicted MFS family arabinose efflux permease|nr:MFS transporter [Candidatus Paceibacterota bacterium]